jgi:putative FmdB family regulatory protein
MPIYEFKCGKCGLCFEEILPADHKAMPPCPGCKTDRKVSKLLSACAQHAGASGSQVSGCAPKGGFS